MSDTWMFVICKGGVETEIEKPASCEKKKTFAAKRVPEKLQISRKAYLSANTPGFVLTPCEEKNGIKAIKNGN